MFSEFRQSHPITFWVLAIGGALIIIWAIGGRIFGVHSSSTQNSTVVAGPTDAQVSAAAGLSIAQLQAQSDAAARADNLTLAEDQLAVGFKIAQLEAARNTNLDTLNYNFGISSLNAQTQQIGIAADVSNHQTDAAAATQQLQITANRDQSLAITNAQVAMNAANNKTQRNSSNNGLFGGIIGAIGSIFSDQRLKENVAFSHVDDRTGLTWYSFNYTENARRLLCLPRGRFVGVMAQDLLDRRDLSFAVERHSSGFLCVNYHAFGGHELAKQRSGLEVA